MFRVPCFGLCGILLLVVSVLHAAVAAAAASFRIRDPFILADKGTATYYLYGAEHYIGETNETTGVWVRKSKDLKTWSEARRVMVARKGTQCVWAPEVHAYKGAYYMFATLKDYPDKANPLIMMGPTPDWSSNMRGLWNSWHAVWIYRAESPEGPFLPVSGKAITPPGWVTTSRRLSRPSGSRTVSTRTSTTSP